MNFSEANKKGRKLEIFLIEKVDKLGIGKGILSPDKYFPDYDVLFPLRLRDITVETKNDIAGYEKYPNNCCIEYGQYDDYGRRKDSGILVTKSDYWAHCNDVEKADSTIYLAHSSVIYDVVNKLLNFRKGLNELYSVIESVEYENKTDLINAKHDEFFDKWKKILGDKLFKEYYIDKEIYFLQKINVEQDDGSWKLMDLCIFRKWIFSSYCIEVQQRDKITFDEFRKYNEEEISSI